MCFYIICVLHFCIFFFFFNDTATTEIYTLSLHDALPIFLFVQGKDGPANSSRLCVKGRYGFDYVSHKHRLRRSEEHTSELQSQSNLVCRLLLEKKKNLHDPLPLLVLPLHAAACRCSHFGS